MYKRDKDGKGYSPSIQCMMRFCQTSTRLSVHLDKLFDYHLAVLFLASKCLFVGCARLWAGSS